MSASAEPRQSPTGEPSTGNPPPLTVRTTGVRRPSTPTLIDISHRLRPRDYTIASLLDELTTLTTHQLTSILFANPTTCRHRLQLLRRLGFIDRFIRNRPGAPNPVCWLPGLLSARYMALAREDSPPTAKALRERQDRVYSSPTLDHLLAVNDFFVSLLVHARHRPNAALTRLWSERSTTGSFGHRIKPDGHGVWRDGDRETGFFLELDRGTEPIGRLIDKLTSHRRLRAEGGPQYPILFALPGRLREQNLHRKLADRPEPSLIIATTSPESGPDPAGPVWRLAGNGRHRLTLADLPSNHGEPGPLNPGPTRPEDHPLRLILDPSA
ncbi:protein involved in plasmid replication-relaxation [Micromonospora sp. Llam0]|uniref:replication-relaxation family protein n=1 Tax=Micromonospora sp. Llam0 TaxID=2485143 RepID=UPI000F48CEB2|nr:replication-relaxation family protein [Micromonospora sp. Llam0]ROO60324.1 protein involved in plasmid replication-relaxation [Micromonospora sp. Llam0]